MAFVLNVWLAVRGRAADSLVLSAQTREQIHILQSEKAARTPAQRKLDSQLHFALRERKHGFVAAGLNALRSQLRVESEDRLLVDLRAHVTPGLLQFIERNGGQVVNSFPRDNAVRARAAWDLIEELAARPDVRSLRPADEAITNSGSIVSGGDVAHRADLVRSRYSIAGAGMKIGVLSDSVDYLAASQAARELPALTVLPGQAGVGAGEGTAMLEIIHDLAPGAELYFATAFSGVASFAQNIRDLHAAGCRIIVDDVIYFVESPLQDGLISQAVNDVSAAGTLFFSSAGNGGSQLKGTSGTWEGDFRDGGPATMAGRGRLHDFGGLTYNTVLPGGGVTRMDLFWADPLGGSTNDYDVYVLNSSGQVVRSSTNIQDGDDDPYESLSFLAVGERVVIVKSSGADRFLSLMTLRGRLAVSTPGSVRGHNASGASNALSVAAGRVSSPPVPFDTATVVEVEPFSSDGPRRMFFRPDGTAITPGDYSSAGGLLLEKPDMTAADGVATSVPGFGNFLGTSAAAPHAAAIAALLWSHKPWLSAAEVRAYLTVPSLDIEGPGMDRNSGAGMVMADRTIDPMPRLVLRTVQMADANGNGGLDANECADLIVELENVALPVTQVVTGITAVLTSSTPGVTVSPVPQIFPDMPAASQATNQSGFRISTSRLFNCGATTDFLLSVRSSNQLSFDLPFQLPPAASALGHPLTNRSATPARIPDLGSVESTVWVTNMDQLLEHVRVAVHVTHPFDNDVSLSLVSPDGTEVILSAANGGDGRDYGVSCDAMTVFSDDAIASITTGAAPFLGNFKPQQPLAVFHGKSGPAVNGLWTLRVRDEAALDIGTLQCWALELYPLTCTDGGGQCLLAPTIVQGPTNQLATEGDMVQFLVHAEGTPPLTYQWLFAPAPNATGNSLFLGTNATFTISNVSPADAGTYWVLVTNRFGQQLSSAATLTVQLRPMLVCQTNRSVDWGSPWDFDTPLTYGGQITLNVASTTTNTGCGDGYSVTRTWIASDTNGLQATCSQTISVLDRRAPVIQCSPDFSVPLGTPWSFAVPTATAAGATSSVVYDNSLNDLLYRLDPGTNEVGDEIILDGPTRQVAQFAFEFWGAGTNAGEFTGDVRARLRFYKNDGRPSASGYASPGTVLFDSGFFPIPASPRAVVVFEDFQVEAAAPLTEPLPDSFTWTVQFDGLASGDSAGLDLYSPPVVGNNYTDYWERDGGEWQLKTNAVGTIDFAARLVGWSRGVTLTALGTMTNGPQALGDRYALSQATVLNVSAPGVLGNDKDASGNVLTAALETGVQHGRLTLNPGGSFIYAPNASYSGPDRFTYRATDGGNNSALATVSLTVLAPDTIPPTTPGNLTGNAIGPRTVRLAWEAASDNVAVDQYLVYRDGNLLATLSGWQTRYQDTGLAPATIYSYEVRAQDAAGNVTPPGSVMASTPAEGFTALVRVNTGGEPFVDDAGNLWSADFGFNTGQTFSIPVAIAGTVNDALYASERYDDSADPELRYTFGVTNGDYTVNLHFAEIWSGASAAGARVFDVFLEGQLRVDDLDIFSQVGAYAPLVLSLPVTVADTELDIAFQHQVENPKISAIEVLVAQSVPETPLSNAVPVAVSDDYSVTQGDLLEVNAPGVLANDTDPEGDRLAAVLEANVQHGTLALDLNGSFVYAPENHYSGPDTFSYRASDGWSNSAPVNVSLNVVSGAPGENVTIITRTWQAVDECGNRTVCSQTAFIEDKRMPQIVGDPESQIAISGEAVAFQVTATGAAPLSYQWHFNETNLLSSATGPALIFNSVQSTNAGIYFATVGNAFGVVTSAVATLAVLEPPVITQHPASLAVTQGQNVAFAVTATGTEPLAFQWFFNESPIPDATGATLNLADLQTGNAGRYVAVVTNAAGSVTSQVAILFLGIPGMLCGTDRTVEFTTPWAFDTPLTYGDDITLSLLTTTTNAGCGEGYRATRTWVATDTNGLQSSCSQTITVLDTRPPTIVCSPGKTVPLGTAWTFDAPIGRAAGVVSSPVYDNSMNDLLYRFDPGTAEVGDEIVLDGPADHVGQFAFEFWGKGTNAGGFSGQVQARVRFYRNDGPKSSSGYASPSTVLFDSGPFFLPAVPRAIAVFEDFQIDAIVPLVAPLPEAFTWTVQFSGLAPGDSAGLDVYSPPVVGSNYSDYWEGVGEAWVLKTNLVPMNFAARLQALNRGVTMTELGTLTNATAGGAMSLTRSWRAADDCGNSATCNQTVTVVDMRPPLISAQPQSQTVNEGGEVSFNVIATGAAPLSYEWRFNQTNAIAGATGPVLLLSDVQATNNGVYAVVVSNAYGAVTSALATLNVFSAPYVVSQPENQNFSPGDTVSFAVLVAGWPPPAYQWFFNETNLVASATNSSLNITNAQSEQAGLYSVVVSNDFGAVTSRLAILTLGVPAFIAVAPQNVRVTPGQTAAFTVGPGGTPPFSFQWFFNCASPLPAAAAATLRLTNVSVADSGAYCVMVSNAYGTALSAPAMLRVLSPPDVFFVTRTGTVVTVTFSTVTNQIYTVQFTDEINAAEWSALRKGSHRPGTGFPIALQDLQATGARRFYRILIE